MGHNAHPRPSKAKLRGPLPIPPGPWVCVEGHEVHAKDVQRGIDNKPIGLCWTCRHASNAAPEQRAKAEAVRRFGSRLVPVMLKGDWHKPPPPVKPAQPMAMFSEAEAPHGFLDNGRVIAERETARHGRARR